MPTSVEIWSILQPADSKAALPSLGRARVEVTHVELDVLASNLKDFLASLQAAIDAPSPPQSAFVVDEIELSLGVNMSGGIAIIGKLEAGAEASVKVTLKRRSQEPGT